MGAAEALSQYFNARKGRVTDQAGAKFPKGKRVLVCSVAALHRSRQTVLINVDPADVEPYFVNVETAKRLLEANEVILLKDAHGNVITEEK
jgi:hypothetical protein